MAENGKIELYCSSLSFSTIFYVLRKLQTSEQLFQTLTDLTDVLTITGVDEKIVGDALNSGFKDLEDAIQYFSALHYGEIETVITRNPKDFKKAKIDIFSTAKFVNSLSKK